MSDALLGEKGFEQFLIETLVGKVDEVVAVGKEDEAEDAPHVVLHIGVEKIHRPTFAGRWKTA